MRFLILKILLCLLLFNINTNYKKPSPDKYFQEIIDYIEDNNCHVSIGYKNLDKNIVYEYNENKIYYGASLIKTLGALYVYENIDIDNNETLKSWVNKAISESDDIAYHKIVKVVGLKNLQEYGKSLGATKALNRGIIDDYYGNTWVNDQLIYMEYLYNFVNSKPNGEELKSYFINDFYNKVKFEELPTVMHKYGYYDKYFHESAIILDDSPYIITILSEESNKVIKENDLLFQELSKKLYNLNNLVKRN